MLDFKFFPLTFHTILVMCLTIVVIFFFRWSIFKKAFTSTVQCLALAGLDQWLERLLVCRLRALLSLLITHRPFIDSHLSQFLPSSSLLTFCCCPDSPIYFNDGADDMVFYKYYRQSKCIAYSIKAWSKLYSEIAF